MRLNPNFYQINVMFQKTIGITVLSSILASLTLPVLATEAIHIVPAHRARGVESKLVVVKVYPYNTGSTIINFRRLREKIRQVSLGGASLFLSSDDPDCLSSMSKRSGQACEATLLYLQQKPKEAVTPTQRIGTTRMSVVTDKNIYVFQIVLASGSPTYSVVEIQPDRIEQSPLVSIEEITTLIKGYEVAVEREYINTQLKSRLRRFLEIVKTEKSVESAAVKAGISMEVVHKLEELGATQSAPSQAPTPVLQ